VQPWASRLHTCASVTSIIV